MREKKGKFIGRRKIGTVPSTEPQGRASYREGRELLGKRAAKFLRAKQGERGGTGETELD